jgi:nucleotide-binding universal stress UspA family protein
VRDRIFRHVLIPTDGSDTSVAAARLAFRVAHSFDARVDLLFVVDLRLCQELRRFDPREFEEIQHELLDQGERVVGVLRDEGERRGLSVAGAVRAGDPFEEIVAHARVLLGSVAERVLEFAPCPVLVVKQRSEAADGR